MHGLKNGFENVLICIISRFRPILNFSIFGKNGASLEVLNIVTVFENSLPKGSSGEIKRNSNFLNCMAPECEYLSANRFSMAWEKGIQVPYPFFVFA